MAKIYMGDKVLIKLDCKEDVDSQTDLWILYQKPVANTRETAVVGRWAATGNGDFAEYETVKNVDLDTEGTWVVQPYSDTHDVHGDAVNMPVFAPLYPWKKSALSVYLEGA